MQIFPFTQKELNFFKELNKNKIPYLIIGMSAAAMQGAPLVTNDVDIWFENIEDKNLQKVFKKCGAGYTPSFGLNPPVFTGKEFNLLDPVLTVHGLNSFKQEYANCLKIKIAGVSFKVLPLERIIKSKKTLNRKKDIQAIAVLKDSLIAYKNKN